MISKLLEQLTSIPGLGILLQKLFAAIARLWSDKLAKQIEEAAIETRSAKTNEDRQKASLKWHNLIK